FPFLQLPTDIRVLVYSYVVSWPTLTTVPHFTIPEEKIKRIVIVGNQIQQSQHNVAVWPPARTSLPLLLTCRQIKDEVLEELLRTPLVFEEGPPYALEYFRSNNAVIYRYLTSYISPSLLCNVRRMVLSIKFGLAPESPTTGNLQSWGVFLVFLWHVWHQQLPKLEHLTIRIGRDGEVLESYLTGAKTSKPKRRIIFALFGILGVLSNTCEVDIDGVGD
ncbi:hypothetical protein K505DRAFT_215583, partial [Melanomma pulvis-pyrius CBS 109.77]